MSKMKDLAIDELNDVTDIATQAAILREKMLQYLDKYAELKRNVSHGGDHIRPSRNVLSQRQAFFQGFSFSLFPLGGMPTFKFNPGDPSFSGPFLERVIKRSVNREFESVAGVYDITNTHFRVTMDLMGLYRISKTIAFDRLCFLSKEQEIIQPTESVLREIETENDWLLDTGS